MVGTRLPVALGLLLASATGLGAEAEKAGARLPIQTVRGVLLDAAGEKPLAGAIIAVRSPDGQVSAWGRTDAAGTFDLTGQYVADLNLPNYGKKDSSPLGEIARGAGRVFDLAGRAITSLIDPVARAMMGPIANAVADMVIDPPGPLRADLPKPNAPGVFLVKVSCPGYQGYQGPVQAYWLDPPDPGSTRGMAFWLDPITLARRGSTDAASGPRPVMMRLRAPVLEPSIAPRGSEVAVTVRLTVPEAAEGNVRVLAWHEKSKTVTPLLPVKSDPGLHRANLEVAADWPLNDQRVVVLALRSTPASPEGPRTATAEELAGRLSLWTGRFAFDPQVLASRDRAVLTLTVVE